MNSRTEVMEKQKPKRIPLGRRNVLTVSGLKDQDEFHYHWFNDSGDRLNNCLEAGYEFVLRSGLSAGDANVDSVRSTDSIMKKGVGGNVTAYLMKIPMELYRADQEAKQRLVDESEAEMKRLKGEGQYGRVEISDRHR